MSQPETSVLPEKPNQVSFYEKRKKIYVKGVRGFFDNWRIALVVFTQILFYVTPWLVWNNRQAVLLHLVERKFYIFGLVFWPQDVIYLAALLIISAYALFLVTRHREFLARGMTVEEAAGRATATAGPSP